MVKFKSFEKIEKIYGKGTERFRGISKSALIKLLENFKNKDIEIRSFGNFYEIKGSPFYLPKEWFIEEKQLELF